MFKNLSTSIVQELHDSIKNLSLYEMNRLLLVLWDELEDPKRIQDVKDRFKVGDRLEWFNPKTNKVCFGIVTKKNRKLVEIINEADRHRWTLPYRAFNLSNKSVEFSPNDNNKLTRQSCSIGEHVGFNANGNSYYGEIVKLNQKTAGINTTCGGKWRVPYSDLVKVFDTELAKDSLLIEGECI